MGLLQRYTWDVLDGFVFPLFRAGAAMGVDRGSSSVCGTDFLNEAGPPRATFCFIISTTLVPITFALDFGGRGGGGIGVRDVVLGAEAAIN
jgi:hypothetical protein